MADKMMPTIEDVAASLAALKRKALTTATTAMHRFFDGYQAELANQHFGRHPRW